MSLAPWAALFQTSRGGISSLALRMCVMEEEEEEEEDLLFGCPQCNDEVVSISGVG
jgi:hypothetical protein